MDGMQTDSVIHFLRTVLPPKWDVIDEVIVPYMKRIFIIKITFGDIITVQAAGI